MWKVLSPSVRKKPQRLGQDVHTVVSGNVFQVSVLPGMQAPGRVYEADCVGNEKLYQ